jgi:hypothetical protein
MTALKVIKGAKGERQASTQNLDAAYRRLEPNICDMARTVEMLDLAADQNDEGLLAFAIIQTLKMAEELKQRYYEAYKG